MIKWLGLKEYEELERRARSFKSRFQAVLECMELLKGESVDNHIVF